MINHGYRIVAAGVLAGAAALAVPAVSSAAPAEVTIEALTSNVDSTLRAKPNFADLWQVTCNGGLKAVVGSTQRCTAVKMNGSRYTVDIRVTSVAAATVDYSYSVTPQR